MPGRPPPSSTLRWCQKEVGPLAEGLRLLFRSQLGYGGRQFEKQCTRKCLEIAVMGGDVVDPLNPTAKAVRSPLGVPSSASAVDVLERANVVAAGIRTFASLLATGTYPGSGGYTLSPTGEKIYGGRVNVLNSQDLLSGLTKVADLLSKGALLLPNTPFPTLQKLGALSSLVAPMFRADMNTALSTPNTRLSHVNNNISAESVAELDTGLTPEEEEFLVNAAKSIDDQEAVDRLLKNKKPKVYRPTLPLDFKVESEDRTAILANSKESSVPATRIGRLASFGQLAFGMVGGAAAEVTRRTFGMGAAVVEGATNNPFLSPANADRIVETLCRVRGAALKLGQMLSIQDEDTVPAALLEVLERVRQSADFMPLRQVNKQMSHAFGSDWRDKFESFEERPFAAASIGQVHKAILKDGRVVAVKIQYPGVAEGIDSDINNLVSVLSIGGVFPKGMFLDTFVKVARRELKQECDYKREARAMKEFRKLVANSKDFYVPEVIESLSSDRVLTTEYVVGKPVDKCLNEPQQVRDYISGKFIELCLKEIFEWRFMQTDPNWSNFYLGVHPVTGQPRLVLLDFGASRAYGKQFVDKYMQIIKAAYDGDDKMILEYSRHIGFLTGYENELMEKAHVESVKIMGETLASDAPYDFSHQNVTKRIHQLLPVMIENRLTSPPEEIYSLHRKLSGSYLLATKLKAVVSCGGLFNELYDNYRFGEDGRDIDIDTVPAEENSEKKI